MKLLPPRFSSDRLKGRGRFARSRVIAACASAPTCTASNRIAHSRLGNGLRDP